MPNAQTPKHQPGGSWRPNGLSFGEIAVNIEQNLFSLKWERRESFMFVAPSSAAPSFFRTDIEKR